MAEASTYNTRRDQVSASGANDQAEMARKAYEIVSRPDVSALIRSKAGLSELLMAIGAASGSAARTAFAQAAPSLSANAAPVKPADRDELQPTSHSVEEAPRLPRYAQRTGSDLKLSAIEFTRRYYGAAIDSGAIPNMEALCRIDPDLARAIHRFRANHKVSRTAMVEHYGMPPTRRYVGDAIERKAQEGQTLTVNEACRLHNRLRYRDSLGQACTVPLIRLG